MKKRILILLSSLCLACVIMFVACTKAPTTVSFDTNVRAFTDSSYVMDYNKIDDGRGDGGMIGEIHGYVGDSEEEFTEYVHAYYFSTESQAKTYYNAHKEVLEAEQQAHSGTNLGTYLNVVYVATDSALRLIKK